MKRVHKVILKRNKNVNEDSLVITAISKTPFHNFNNSIIFNTLNGQQKEKSFNSSQKSDTSHQRKESQTMDHRSINNLTFASESGICMKIC